jgi:Lrp/AsnC family leucine-responsive transcriptional regulator
MEPKDQHILALLARNGRMSYTELGRETGLSTSAAQQRVRRLEQKGVITGYQAQIDPAALGKNLTAFISIRPISPQHDNSTPLVLAQTPEVVSCFSVAGDASYLCMVEVGTPADLDELLTKLRHEVNVMTVTTVVLTTVFRDRPLVNMPGEEPAVILEEL